MKELKRTADYFGIAKEVDWTVPLMVKEEEEKIEAEAPKGLNTCAYLKEMDQRYLALKGNPGLEYKMFTEYRFKRSSTGACLKTCLEDGLYPENKPLQKLRIEAEILRKNIFPNDWLEKSRANKKKIEKELKRSAKIAINWQKEIYGDSAEANS